jgi:hypothetical protein
LAAASAVILALQVAIGAAAPEFIWRGLLAALDHPSWGDLFSALLIGLNLAFFVEPVMERLRDALDHAAQRKTGGHRARDILFTASLSLAFALTSVCLHDAMVAFVSGRGVGGPDAALVAGVALIAAWAIVPFAVTLAWQSLGRRWLAAPMTILAAASPGIAGWLFSWSGQEIVTTAIPCWGILGLGCRAMLGEAGRRGIAQGSRLVVLVAAVWLAVVLLGEAVLGWARFDGLQPYNAANFFLDMRFYLGWALGLALLPVPRRHNKSAG